MAASSSQATTGTAALDGALDDAAPTERPVRPSEPHKPRQLKDPVKNAERMAEYHVLHDAWKLKHAAWQVDNERWKKAQKKASRPDGDGQRRVAQKRKQNPNIVPDSVALFFSRWRDGEEHERSCADILAGVDPPQSLIDFLDGGGSVDAHVQGGKFTLLQLAAEARVGPKIIDLLLQRGAKPGGNLTTCSPLELATWNWKPFTGHCRPVVHCTREQVFGMEEDYDWEADPDRVLIKGGCRDRFVDSDEGCVCVAFARANEQVMRSLLSKGATCYYAAAIIFKKKAYNRHNALWNDEKLRSVQSLFRSHHNKDAKQLQHASHVIEGEIVKRNEALQKYKQLGVGYDIDYY